MIDDTPVQPPAAAPAETDTAAPAAPTPDDSGERPLPVPAVALQANPGE